MSTALPARTPLTPSRHTVIGVRHAALARFGRPEIFNTDQGSQFTGAAFTGRAGTMTHDYVRNGTTHCSPP